jgi:antitoxin ParD1/3/4
MTSKMNIILSEPMKSFVDARVKDGGYKSHSDYLRDLVRRDEIALAENALRERLALGLASPVGRSWPEIENELRSRLTANLR